SARRQRAPPPPAPGPGWGALAAPGGPRPAREAPSLRSRCARSRLRGPSPRLGRAAPPRAGAPRRRGVFGGVSHGSVPVLVQAGARVISVGRITHSAPSLDLSLEVIDVH